MDPLSVATPELSPPAEDKLQNASGKERVSDIVARDGEHVVDDERAASPAAPVSPPESAVKEAAVVSAEGTLSDPAPLPVLWLNAIPFKDVAGRMIQAANTKFQTLLTTLPNAPPLDRQQQLLQYAATQHAEFQKLLVLTRFLRKAQDWQQVMNVHGLIDRRTESLTRAGHHLRGMVGELKARAETSAPDVLTAIDVLANHTYTQLPRILKDNLPPKPPDQHATGLILAELEKLIRRRLELEIVPDAMRKHMVVERGCVTFRVGKLFQVALTLVGDDFSLPWVIVELEFLVQSAEAYKGLFSGLLVHQKWEILQRAQSLLESVQKRDPRGPGNHEKFPNAATVETVPESTSNGLPEAAGVDTSRRSLKPKSKRRKLTRSGKAKGKAADSENGHAPNAVNGALETMTNMSFVKEEPTPGMSLTAEQPFQAPVAVSESIKPDARKPHNPYPILYLFNFLNRLLLRVQLEILSAQARSLARTHWHGLLKVEENREKELLRLVYWDHMIPGPDPRTVPAGYEIPHRHQVLEIAIKTTTPVSNRAFEKWMIHRKRKRGHLKHLNAAHVCASLFGDGIRPQPYLDITGYAETPDLRGNITSTPLANPENGARISLSLDPSCLDLATLLTTLVDLQARFLIHRIRNILLGVPEHSALGTLQLASTTPIPEDTARQPSVALSHTASHIIYPSSASSPFGVPSNQSSHLHEPPIPCFNQAFRSEEVRIEEWLPTGEATAAIQSELRITLHDSTFTKVNVNPWTGRIRLVQPGAATLDDPFSRRTAPILTILEQRLNDRPSEALEIFLYMRYSSYINQIAAWCQRIGLNASTTCPLKPNEETSIAGIPLRNKIYIRIPGCSEAWILIAAASARDWASGTAMETEDLDTALRVWLVDTKFEGQSIRRFGRAKREMNREITCLTPIFASDALDDQTALKYAYARQRTTVQNGPRAALEYWRVMDPDALSAIERVCRLRHAYRLVIRGITSRNLSYGYLSPTGSSVTLPDELTAEDTETRIARREAKLCIPEDDIAGALGLHSADTISAQASAPIFGDLYLSLEHTVLAGRESGPGSLPNERLPIGNTSPLRGVRITAICGVRLGPARDMIVQRDVSNGMWLYKAATNALHFTFVGVRLMESCIASILDELRAIGSLVELARQASVNQARLREIGARVVSFDLQCLSVCYQNTLSIKISAVDPQQQLLGLEIAANGGGRRQFQAELISAGATDQSRQIPVQIVDRIKGFWEERLNKDGNLPNSLLLLWHLAPLFRMVRDLEHERNVGMYTVGEGVPFVSLVFQSLTRVQLVYAGLYGVEFGLLPSGQIGFYDSTQLPGRVSPPIPPTGIPLSVQRRRLLQPPPPNPADGLARIPLFSGLIQTICRAVHDTALPRGTTVVPLCFGVLFDPPLLKFVVEKMDSHLNNVGLLLWLENEAAKKLPLPKGFPKNALVDLPSMRATIRTETRGVIVKVSAASTWDVTMIPFAKAPGGALHEPFLTPELLTGLAQLLATKLNALPPGTDLRPFFIFFLDFLAMPADLLLNFVTIARDEALSRQRGPSEEPMTVEWCLAIPSDAPAYLGASGAPATLLEVDKRRVSVMFRLTNRPTGEHALVPVRYNWSTKVIGRWLRPGADDLTEISEMNPFMEQHMHNAQQEDSLAGLMARATLRGKPNENQTSPSAEIATLLKTASLKCTEAGMQWIRA